MNKRVLTLQDYSAVGKCSLTAAVPLLTACGVDPVGFPTAVLSTQTAGIDGFTFQDMSKNIMPAYKHWKSLGIKFDCLYTGFLGNMKSAAAAIAIAEDLKKSGTLIAVDPAMAENGELYPIFDTDYRDKMFELCSIADIVMPNFTEGKMLAGLDMTLFPSVENANMILNILRSKDFKCVLLSGIMKNGQIGAALLSGGKITFHLNVSFDRNIHGAGDCLSSVYIGKLLSGSAPEAAAQTAVDFCKDVIELSINEGVDLRYGLMIENLIGKLVK